MQALMWMSDKVWFIIWSLNAHNAHNCCSKSINLVGASTCNYISTKLKPGSHLRDIKQKHKNKHKGGMST